MRKILTTFFIFILSIGSVHAQSIYQAVIDGDRNLIENLLKDNPDLLHIQDPNGVTLLHTAVITGKIEICRLLIEKGMYLDHKNNNGFSPLFLAMDRGRNAIAGLLIDKGADIDGRGYRNRTILHMAVNSGNLSVLKMILKRHPDLSEEDIAGDTALDLLFTRGYLEEETGNAILKLMIDNGADVNAKDHNGTSILIRAVEHKLTEAAIYLIKSGSNVSESDFDGMTTLHHAVVLGSIELVKAIVERNVDLNAKTLSGDTPLSYAYKYGFAEIAGYLLTNGALKNQVIGDTEKIPGFSDQIKSKEAVIWYLGDSGWAVKTSNHLLIFDYAPPRNKRSRTNINEGDINIDDIKGQDIVVLVSHPHGDHYNREIFEWEKHAGSAKYYFGWKEDNTENRFYLDPGESIVESDLEVHSIKADHRNQNGGSALVIQIDGLVFYHSGDHGAMRKKLYPEYTSGIDDLAEKGLDVDIAFNYAKFYDGIEYMVSKLNPEIVFPQHWRGREHLYKKVKSVALQQGLNTRIVCAKFVGDRFFFKKGIIR